MTILIIYLLWGKHLGNILQFISIKNIKQILIIQLLIINFINSQIISKIKPECLKAQPKIY